LDKVFGRQEESSYNIPEEEKKTILSSAVRFSKEVSDECTEDSYGEILQTSAAKLFSHPLVQMKPGETFADLGSGLGQLVMDAVFLGEAKRAVGIELSAARSKEACSALQEVSKALPATQLSGWRAARHESQTEILQGDVMGLTDEHIGDMEDEEIEGTMNVEDLEDILDEYIQDKADEQAVFKAIQEPIMIGQPLRKGDIVDDEVRVTEETRAIIEKHYTYIDDEDTESGEESEEEAQKKFMRVDQISTN